MNYGMAEAVRSPLDYGGANQSLAGVGQAIKREPEIPAELGRLEKTIAELGAVAEQLIMRVGPVLRKETEVQPQGHPPESVPATQVAEQIIDLRRQVAGIAGRLARAAQAVEL